MTAKKPAQTLDERIAEMLREAEASGELATSPLYGKPLDFGDGYEDTPPELRMGFKILKDAQCAPPEVAMLKEIAQLRAELEALTEGAPEADALRRRITDLEITVALRVDRLARGTL